MKRFIGVLRFDAIATFEEFQVIVMGLLEQGFDLEILKLGGNILPSYSSWQLVISKGEEDGVR